MIGLDLATSALIDRPDVVEQAARGRFGPFAEQALQLAEQGFCLLDLRDEAFPLVAEQIRVALEPQFDLESWRQGRAANLRLQDGWRFCSAISSLAGHPLVLQLLETLYGRSPFCFQTLNFPVGSQQHFHSDALHFHSYPFGFMCGVWIALEDIQAGSGPLVYYPGSHRLPYCSAESEGFSPEQVAAEPHPQRLFEPFWRQQVKQGGFAAESFLPRQGQALIWHANLLHGGLPVQQRQLTRWSQVSHYYFHGCLYTTPMHSFCLAAGGARLRDPIDVGQPKRRFPHSDGILVTPAV